MRLSTYVDLISTDFGETIGVNYFTREVSVIEDTIEAITANPAYYHSCESSLFTEKSPEQEFYDFVYWFDCQSSDLSSLKIIWAVTAQCNLACIYCYEDGGFKSIPYSSRGICSQHIIAVLKKYHGTFGTNDFHLSFYGGEPTIEASEIVECVGKISELGLQVSYSLFTNGYKLPKALLNTIVQNRFSYIQITIDGTREIHNRLRPTKAGGPTFDAILSNMVQLLDNGVNVELTMNFDSTNSYSILSFLEKYSFLKRYKSLTVAFAPIFITKYKEPILGKRRSWEEIGSNWYRLLVHSYELGYNVDMFRLFHRGICSYHRQGSLIIHPSGHIYKCIGGSGNAAFRVADIATLLENPNSFNESVRKNMRRPFISEPKCRFCKYLPLCLGGCRFHASEELNNIELPYCHKELIQNCDTRIIEYLVMKEAS